MKPALFLILVSAAPDEFNVRDFGAAGDGKTPDTPALQAAVDACVRSGGGTVLLPPGEYLSGTIRLGDRVHLRIQAGATLLQSRRPEDHPRARCLLWAQKASGIAVEGPGRIVGIGEADLGRRADRRDAALPSFRAGILRFEECRDVVVRNLTVLFSDAWTLHFRFCEGVAVEDVTIRNNYFRTNSDGVDPVSCRRVRIARCDIVAGDDCIVCKTDEGRPCEDVQVRDCRLESIATALKLGTESSGDFRDLEFLDCTIRNSTVGIGLFLKDGGTMERVRFRRISIETYTPRGETNVEKSMFPVFMDIERRNADSKAGRLRDVTLEDVSILSGSGALVQGMPESPIENLTLRNLRFRVRDPQDWSGRRKHIGGRRTLGNQRDTEFARLPGWFVAAHVRGLTVDGLQVAMSEEDFLKFPRSALIASPAERAEIRNVTRDPDGREPPPVVVKP